MKHLLIIFCVFGCKSKSGSESSDIIINKAIERIHNLPEVMRLEKKISTSTNGAHGVAYISNVHFNGDSSIYHIQVGDNSKNDRYVVIYNFLVDKKSGAIKAYDAVRDSILSIRN
jgi:hypothetical protein